MQRPGPGTPHDRARKVAAVVDVRMAQDHRVDRTGSAGTDANCAGADPSNPGTARNQEDACPGPSTSASNRSPSAPPGTAPTSRPRPARAGIIPQQPAGTWWASALQAERVAAQWRTQATASSENRSPGSGTGPFRRSRRLKRNGPAEGVSGLQKSTPIKQPKSRIFPSGSTASNSSSSVPYPPTSTKA